MLSSPTDHRRRIARAAFIVVAAAIAAWIIFASRPLEKKIVPMPRPFGMVPPAFKAYLHACRKTGIDPNRLTQTIGDSPNSFGYHLKDGTLKVNGARIEYCAATDFGTRDLQPAQIARFVRELERQGFACWYRQGGKWKGIEHIHAVYALVPMKAQLRRQVNGYVREEKPHWTKKWQQGNR